MQTSSAFNLMFDFDGMMDTRMGTLLTMRDDIPTILPLQKYRQRTMDDWETLTGGLITNAAFQERYARRDLNVLRRSIMTGMVPVVISYIDTLKERFFRGVDISSINVDLNTWPYVLPGPLAETFQNCLRVLLPAYVTINMCHTPPETMTPTFMKSHYNGWVTYNVMPWLEQHQEELLGVPVNELSVITPKLTVKELEGAEESDAALFAGVDKHGLLELIMEDFVHIEHVPVSDFCFVVPRSYMLPEEEEDDPQFSSSRSSRMARSEASTD
ncbi:hypothetical protein D3C87_981650 [compost metagenome]